MVTTFCGAIARRVSSRPALQRTQNVKPIAKFHQKAVNRRTHDIPGHHRAMNLQS
jgi:hypothetical protein